MRAMVMVLVMMVMVGNVSASVESELSMVFDAQNIVVNNDGSFTMVIDGVTCEDLKVEMDGYKLSDDSHAVITECIAD